MKKIATDSIISLLRAFLLLLPLLRIIGSIWETYNFSNEKKGNLLIAHENKDVKILLAG